MIRRTTAMLLAIGLMVPILTLIGNGNAAAASNVAASAPAGQDFDVWLRAGGKVHVKSGSCRDLTFQVRHNGGVLDSFDAEVEVWRGSKYLGQTFDYQYDSSGPLRASYYWCPYEGLGKLRLGPTDVEWTDDDWASQGQFWDSSRAVITVKQHQTCRVDWSRKARGRVKVNAKLRFYAVNAYRWANAPKGTVVKLQRKAPRGWKLIDRARVGKKGKVHLDGRAIRKKTRYRVVQSGTNRTWSCEREFRK
ncbi:hypothetical protein KUV85_13935 [Nocardioides panacisoli]|uniref:hypothetical protein n=1 Tax=Nocardioides panacisoli TaxID=627624 RepID=UPI001C632BD0|nr:hypothetical protein [Nocardioides panacisoli]QYJ03419.1 hypothetical protein KUV85_13935 [Nocardioides panacisoli]